MSSPTLSPTVEAIQVTSETSIRLIFVIIFGISIAIGLGALLFFCICVSLRRHCQKKLYYRQTYQELFPFRSHPQATVAPSSIPDNNPPPHSNEPVQQNMKSRSDTKSSVIQIQQNAVITPKKLFPTPPPSLSLTSTTPTAVYKNSSSEELLNKAFVFLHPAANTVPTQSFLCDHLTSKGFHISDQCIITGSELLSCYQTYTAHIAHYAFTLHPSEMDVTLNQREQFEAKFGISWKEATIQGSIQNAQATQEILQVTPQELNQLWNQAIEANYVIQFSSDCWVGLLERRSLLSESYESQDVEDAFISNTSIFCVNGHFPDILNQYYIAANTTGIWCCNVSWSDSLISWRRVLDEVIGHPNPVIARDGSIRKIFYSEWKDLEHHKRPSVEENGIHFSVSAFEACVEREIWTGAPLSSDPLGCRFSTVGLTSIMARDWMNNIRVHDMSVYEHMEGLGCFECLEKIRELLNSKPSGMLSPDMTRLSNVRINSSFLLFSPEVSSCPAALTLISNTLTSYGCRIASQGNILPDDHPLEKLDTQYSEASRYAFILSPSAYQLTPKFRIYFQKFYNISWGDALHDPQYGGVYNATEAMRRYHLSSMELHSLWCHAVENNQILAFSNEIYCAYLEYYPHISDKISSPLPMKFFCINGYYPFFKEGYDVKKRRKLLYCCVEWDPNFLSWENFNNEVIGDGNGVVALSSSVRGQLYEKWYDLSGKDVPKWNGFHCQLFHCSRSAWDGMREKSIWLNLPVENDPVAQELVHAGVTKDQLVAWYTRNSFHDKKIIVLGESHQTISDLLEGKGVNECIAVALETFSNTTGNFLPIFDNVFGLDGTSLLSSPLTSHPSPHTADVTIQLYPTPTLSSPSHPRRHHSSRHPHHLTPIPSPIIHASSTESISTPKLMALTPLITSYPSHSTPYAPKYHADMNSTSLDSIPEKHSHIDSYISDRLSREHEEYYHDRDHRRERGNGHSTASSQEKRRSRSRNREKREELSSKRKESQRKMKKSVRVAEEEGLEGEVNEDDLERGQRNKGIGKESKLKFRRPTGMPRSRNMKEVEEGATYKSIHPSPVVAEAEDAGQEDDLEEGEFMI